MNSMNEDTVRTLLADVAAEPQPVQDQHRGGQEGGAPPRTPARVIASGAAAVAVGGSTDRLQSSASSPLLPQRYWPSRPHEARPATLSPPHGSPPRPRARKVQPAGVVRQAPALFAQLLERGGERHRDADPVRGEPGAWADPQGQPPRLVSRSQPLREHPGGRSPSPPTTRRRPR